MIQTQICSIHSLQKFHSLCYIKTMLTFWEVGVSIGNTHPVEPKNVIQVNTVSQS